LQTGVSADLEGRFSGGFLGAFWLVVLGVWGVVLWRFLRFVAMVAGFVCIALGYSGLEIVFFALVGGCSVLLLHFRPLWIFGVGFFCFPFRSRPTLSPVLVYLVGFVCFLFRLRRTFFAPFCVPLSAGLDF